MANRAHITTAITYSNGPPHVGHAYEYLATDTYVRHLRRRLGRKNVSFVTGTDEHGDTNYRAAIAEGLQPKPFADKISAFFRAAHAGLNISYDHFVRTTDPVHEKFVRKMLQRARDNDEIYYTDYEGLYCIGCERFYTEKELLPGNVCPAHKRPVELIKEGNYFLRLEKHRDEIREYVDARTSSGPSAIATKRSTCSPSQSRISASRVPRRAWIGESSCPSMPIT